MRRRLVAGNWKMHGSMAANKALLSSLKRSIAVVDGFDVAVCAPYPYLAQLAESLHGSPLTWGAQDLSEHDFGAFTGEVSGPMLAEFGCTYALVGHSERRVLHRETDLQIAAKFGAAQRAGLMPILCVGETLEQRDGGEMQAVLQRQVDAVLKTSGVAAFKRAVLAYEPVWAIGTGRTASPTQAQAAHLYLRSLVAAQDAALASELTIVYGGSVKPGNAKEIFSMPDVDGGLIGGASLVAEDFTSICSAAVAAR